MGEGKRKGDMGKERRREEGGECAPVGRISNFITTMSLARCVVAQQLFYYVLYLLNGNTTITTLLLKIAESAYRTVNSIVTDYSVQLLNF